MNNKEKTKQDELTLKIVELISKLLDDLCLFDSLSQSASVSLLGSPLPIGSKYDVFLI